jgi:hypothetical protein
MEEIVQLWLTWSRHYYRCMKFVFLALAILTTATSAQAEAPAGSSDPIFETIPFDRWSEKEGAHFRWTTQISKPALNQHQRLMVNIKIQVDGAELIKREGQGKVLLLVQLRDQGGRLYQVHNELSLENVSPDANRTLAEYFQNAFVTPGDYQISLGLFVPKTGEHAIARRPLHVDPLPHDPLGDAWRDLPSVEFIPEDTPPDSWYLPTVEGRMNLHVETERPVNIDLLVNGSSTEELPQTHLRRAARIGVGTVMPTAKVLSQIKLSNGSSRIALLDLERRRVAFEQTLTDKLNWRELKPALTEAEPNKIDVAALENRQYNAQFFLSEIQRRFVDSIDTKQVLIILSGPMAFDKADITPIQELDKSGGKVFYIRFHPMIARSQSTPFVFGGADEGRGRGGSGRTGRGGRMNPGLPPSDELFNLTKPLHPRLFDVTTPEEVRKAIATILSEISRLGND